MKGDARAREGRAGVAASRLALLSQLDSLLAG